MLIPQIKYSSDTSTQQLVQTIKHWSLFGQVAIIGIDATAVDDVKSILRQVGGTVDISIEFESSDAAEQLAMLNEGACRLLNRDASQDSETVPSDRQINLIENPPPRPGHSPKHAGRFGLSNCLADCRIGNGKNRLPRRHRTCIA